MIPRYSRPEMTAIWEPENKFRIWFEIEAHACDAQAELGVIPREAAQAVWERGAFEVDRIDEIERETKHDVIAFLTNLAEHVGPEARFVHQGMTSSDVLDTCLAVQLTQASDILLAGMDRVLAALKKRALEHKHSVCLGRSHGIHAEPTTFGVKLAGHYAAFARGRKRLEAAREEIATCAISGAVGTFANIDPFVEEYVAAKLGLQAEPVSTQVIPRDRHAAFFAALGVIAASVENLATEIRHLQRTEVREAEEYFAPGQKGSSAMPHKRNPVLTENLTGLARIVPAAVVPALENVTLWHERDISHSSVERMIGPDTTVTLDFALNRLAGVVEKLLVYPETMQKNLDQLGGLVHSQRVLLALTQAGISREDSYRLVQETPFALRPADAVQCHDGRRGTQVAQRGRDHRRRTRLRLAHARTRQSAVHAADRRPGDHRAGAGVCTCTCGEHPHAGARALLGWAFDLPGAGLLRRAVRRSGRR
jgi:adenylosuccinate lyase